MMAMFASFLLGQCYYKCFQKPNCTTTATVVQPEMTTIDYNNGDILQLKADTRENHEQTETEEIPDWMKRELIMEKVMAQCVDILQLMADAEENHKQTETEEISDLAGHKEKDWMKRELNMEKIMAQFVDILQLIADPQENHKQTETEETPDLAEHKERYRMKRELTMEELMAQTEACPNSSITNQACKTECCEAPPVKAKVIISCGLVVTFLCIVGIASCIFKKFQNKTQQEPMGQASGGFFDDSDETRNPEEQPAHTQSPQ